jgi:hypothetical protein
MHSLVILSAFVGPIEHSTVLNASKQGLHVTWLKISFTHKGTFQCNIVTSRGEDLEQLSGFQNLGSLRFGSYETE